MTTPSSSPTRSDFKPGIFVFGGIQLILGIVSANWAWTLWRGAERVLPANFWGVLALMVFLLGIAQINLVGPLRTLGYKLPAPKIALPYRLKQPFAEVFSPWPLLSIAFAFGAPVFPMILFLLRVEGTLAELDLIWIGLILMGIIIGGATLFFGLQKLYVQLNGIRTVVEASAIVVKPGESFSIFVRHTPGRLVTESIEVKLICRKTVIQSRSRSSGKISDTKVIFETDVQPETPTHFEVWQDSWAITIPKEVQLSTDPGDSRSITWGIDVIARIPNAPDVMETFVFKVDDPEMRARWEAEWEIENV